MKFKPIGTLLILTGLAVQAAAQNAVQTTRAYKTEVFEASTVDTRTFFPQVDDSFELHPVSPENPLLRKRVTPPPNPNFPVGGIIDQPRGTNLSYFPGPSATGWNPPDPDIAVGPNNIVCGVNVRIGFYNKATGAQTFLQDAQAFFGVAASVFLFDPKVIYDRVHGRFVIMFLEQSDSAQVSNVRLAISDDSDPNGTWYKYTINSEYNNTHWLDYSSLGYNKDAIVVNGNLFGYTSGFAGVHYLIIPTDNILNGGAATTKYIFSANPNASVQVAEMIDPTIDRVYGAQDLSANSFRLVSLNNLLGAAPTLTTFDRSVTAFTYSDGSISAGTSTVDALDGRVFNAVFRGGKLLTSHCVGPNPERVRWYEFNMSNWPVAGSPTVQQIGNVSNAAFQYHMPAITKNAAGDISIIFSKSANPQPVADIMRSSRVASDAAGVMGTPVLLESATAGATAANTSGRWGDYAGCEVDPVDDYTFWGFTLTVNAAGNWRTSFFSWVVTPPPTPVDVSPAGIAVSPGAILSGSSTDLGASDDVRVVMRPGAVLVQTQDPLVAVVNAVSPYLNPSAIEIKVESNTSILANEKIEYQNSTGSWVLLDSSAAAQNADGIKTFNITSSASSLVNQTTGAIALRLSYKNTGAVLVYPWQARVDWIRWHITP